MTCGIYCIQNMIDNKKYIGYSRNIESRFKKHIDLLQKNKHPNVYLQNAFSLFKKDNFKFYILEEIENNDEELKLMEIYFIAYHNSYVKDGFGYNLTRGGDGTFGYRYTSEQSETLSKAQIRRFQINQTSEETRKKLSERMSGPNNPNWGKSGSTNPNWIKMSGSENPALGKFGSDHPTQKSKNKNI